MKIRMLTLLKVITLLLVSSNLFGTTRYWVGSSSTNWNTAANWNGGTLPANGDVIYIANGTFAVGTNLPTISAAPAFTPASITIGNTKIITLTINAGFTLSVPTITMSSTSNTSKISVAGTLDVNNVTMASATSIVLGTTGILKLSGDIQGGTLDASANGSTVILDGTTAQSFPNTTTVGGTAIDHLDIYNTYYGSTSDRGVTLTGATVNQTTLEANAIFNANGTLTVGTGYMLTMKANSDYISKSTFTFRANDIIDPSGTIEYTSPTQIVNLYTPNAGQTNLPPNVVFTGTTIQINSGTSPNTSSNFLVRGNLTSSGSTTVTFSGITTINIQGDFKGTSNIDLATNAIPVTIEGSWLNTAADAPTKLITYDGNVASNTQVVSTAITYGAGLTMTNASPRKVNSGTLAVTGTLSTSGGAVDLNTNDPTVTVTGSWTNAATVTQDAGSITITGNVTNNSGGTLALGSGNLSIAGNYTNNSGGVYTQGTGTTYFNGSAAQSLSDVSTTGTVFGKVNFSGTSLSNAKTMSGSGGFAVAGTGTLTMANATTKLDAGGVLTLMSDASSTATVAQMPTGAVITGNVNAQRYLTGGAGFRGYRLMSPPVNISSNLSGAGNIGLSYISTSQTFGGVTYRGALTGGQGTGFFVSNANPSLYLYNEALITNNSNSFVSGKNVGVYTITATGVTTTSGYPAVQTTGVTIPVGNSFLFFFIGDNSSTQTASAVRTPENTTITATGYLNQGNIPVKFWNTNSTSIPYHTGTGAILPGYNQVGNPYASTISLDVLYTDNYNASTNAISPIFWEMSQPAQTYISYNAVTHTTSSTKAGKYIVSGQGFIIDATATGQTVTFKEDQKVSYPAITKSTTPALLMSTKNDIRMLKKSFSTPAQENTPAGMHLQLTKDSMVNTQCGIYFAKEWDDKFYNTEDALDLDGASPKVYLSSYSADGVRTSINQLADYKQIGKKVRLFVKTTKSGLYNLDLVDINADTVQYKFYLIDHFKNDSLDIGRYKSYAFNIVTEDTATFGGNRFELSVQQQPASKYQLVTFTAQKATDGVLVTWRTYNDGSNYFFTLEKQEADGSSYATLYQVQSNGGTIYKYTDKLPNTGNNVYRLKQVDLFGNISYSSPVSIYFDKSGNADMFSVYPNPTAETLNVNVTNGKTTTVASSYKLNIYDITGAVVVQKTSVKDSWSENVSQFIPGVYIVELKDAGGNSLGKAKFVKK
ncbi:T9SS type A sorting domain-containing protein [Mucilaginibacter sp. OK283]|uniref:T9SS type A sorting domain-containing protein n=1 Tax=Mucilaginibacter sp. OK283 TaxID=1881049 RepID=UPI0008D244AF|nr:T9SS type A sorting domain-containing protein [Mucilaginibacter sp. OK283]SEO41185.1 Por secretion system C-terminal sorting domain-containing protein [Mucilaginibacter sp. OK283]